MAGNSGGCKLESVANCRGLIDLLCQFSAFSIDDVSACNILFLVERYHLVVSGEFIVFVICFGFGMLFHAFAVLLLICCILSPSFVSPANLCCLGCYCGRGIHCITAL